MESKVVKILILATISVIVIFSAVYFGQGLNSFSVEYESSNGYLFFPWARNYTVDDTEVTFFVQNMTEWNEYFYIRDSYVPINYTEDPYGLPEWVPDFKNYSYAMLDYGPKNTGGYSINFVSATFKSGIIEFHYTKSVPQGAVTMALTWPISFIQIPNDQFEGHEITGYSFILDE